MRRVFIHIGFPVKYGNDQRVNQERALLLIPDDANDREKIDEIGFEGAQ